MDERLVGALLDWMQLARTTLEALRETAITMDQRQRSLAATRRLAQAGHDLRAMQLLEQGVRSQRTPPAHP